MSTTIAATMNNRSTIINNTNQNLDKEYKLFTEVPFFL